MGSRRREFLRGVVAFHDGLKQTAINLRRDRSGNIALLFALILVPLLGAVGAALDYARAYNLQSELQFAADSAVLGAVSEQSVGVLDALKNNTTGSISLAEEDARKLFAAQLSGRTTALIDKVTVTITRVNGEFNATLTFNAHVPTTLMQVLGWQNVPISGTAKSTFSSVVYTDFYMLLDNTPSMGVGATSTDIALLEKKTSDSCAFACHDMSNSSDYYSLAKKLGVSMRIDVVRQATQNLTETADGVKRYPNQYRMAIYTFGTKAEAAGLTRVADLSSDMKKVKKNANAIDLMTIPYQNYNGDQQTAFDAALTSMKKEIGTPGDGNSAASPQKVLFFVSDGVGDSNKPKTCTRKTTSSGRCQEPIDISFCKPLKDAGVKVAVLYTTYLPLPKNSWYNTWIKPFQNDISTKMKSCASDGLFFEVSPTDGISDAMNALFKKIVTTPRLTG